MDVPNVCWGCIRAAGRLPANSKLATPRAAGGVYSGPSSTNGRIIQCALPRRPTASYTGPNSRSRADSAIQWIEPQPRVASEPGLQPAQYPSTSTCRHYVDYRQHSDVCELRTQGGAWPIRLQCRTTTIQPRPSAYLFAALRRRNCRPATNTIVSSDCVSNGVRFENLLLYF